MNKKFYFSYLHIIEWIIVANVLSVVLLNNRNSPFYAPLAFAKALYVVEIIAFLLCMVLFLHMKMRLSNLLFITLYVAGQIIAYTYANQNSFLISFSIHKVLLWIMAIYIFYFCADTYRWTKKNFCNIMNFLVFFGFIACSYNILANWSRILMILQRPSLYIVYRSMFKSFFSTKSTFAMLVFFSSCAALYFASEGKKIYYVVYFFFFINIVLSNARSIIVVTFFALLAFEIRNKKFIYTIIVLLLALFAIYFVIHTMGRANFIDAFLFHDRSGADISSGRFSAWRMFFEKTNFMRLMVGYGFGSNNVLPGIYSTNFNYGSYHSMYVDCICQGGILYLGIMLYLWVNTITSMLKCNAPRQIKILFGVMALGYAAVMVTDSLGTLFETQIWSFISTILVITLPAGIAAQDGEIK